MTQLEQARRGVITDQMRQVAETEKVDPEFLCREVAAGRLVIPANIVHLQGKLKPIGIGRSITTKINANLGASPLASDEDGELTKLNVALKYGADTVMDLSTGEKIDE